MVDKELFECVSANTIKMRLYQKKKIQLKWEIFKCFKRVGASLKLCSNCVAQIDLRYLSTGNDMIIWEVTIFSEDNLHNNVLAVIIVICIVNVFEADSGSFAWLDWVITLSLLLLHLRPVPVKKKGIKTGYDPEKQYKGGLINTFWPAFWFLWNGKGKRIRPFPLVAVHETLPLWLRFSLLTVDTMLIVTDH